MCNCAARQIQSKCNESDVNKQVFNLKSIKRDGLMLRIVHTDGKEKIRFVHATFNKTSNILAAADNFGSIFVVDLHQAKFWGIEVIDSCTVLKFSSISEDEVIVGLNYGDLQVLNVQTAIITGQLLGHDHSVKEISFSYNNLCLSSSSCEAIIWDLETCSKVQVLNLNTDCTIKYVYFIPTTNNIIACFHDDVILVWKYGTFEKTKEIQPTYWNKSPIKSIAFTKNGKAMVVGGYSSNLYVFLIDTWCLSKTITLPECIKTIRKLEFVPQPFDGGCNRVLALLSGDGILYFYDMEQNIILNYVTEKLEIIRYECCIYGKYLACVLCSGEISIYSVTHCSVPFTKEVLPKAKIANGKTKVYKCIEKLGLVQKQLKEILSIEKLRCILKEFGEYPAQHRMEIWKELLQLPNNKDYYNALINHKVQSCFEELETDYPLVNKITLKNLKRLLNNIVAWCPFFACVKSLPLFVFPFVKVFENNPVICFEALCVIVVNWCQYWYEYFPLPPVNVLAMIENVFLEHNSKLLAHLAKFNVTSTLYAWPLLETAFSEVLTTSEWCLFWDHVLTNEPSFLLMAVVSYSTLQQQMLLSLNNSDDFDRFYHNQNPVSVKRLVSKTYTLLENTSEKFHPRQYLNYFKKIEIGAYPHFSNYPKTIVDYEVTAKDYLEKEKQEYEQEQAELLENKIKEQKMLLTMEIMDTENARLQELEKVCVENIEEEKQIVEEHRKRLCDLRKQLHTEKMEMLDVCRNKILQQNMVEKERELNRLRTEMDTNKFYEHRELQKAREDLLQHYSELLKSKVQIQELVGTDRLGDDTRYKYVQLKKYQEKLQDDIKKVREEALSGTEIKQLVVSSGIGALDELIKHVEIQLTREATVSSGVHKNVSIVRLEAATKELEAEVEKLLRLLAECKLHEGKDKISRFHEDVLSRRKRKEDLSGLVDSSQIDVIAKDYGKIKDILHSARDGYEARPSSPASVCHCKSTYRHSSRFK